MQIEILSGIFIELANEKQIGNYALKFQRWRSLHKCIPFISNGKVWYFENFIHEHTTQNNNIYLVPTTQSVFLN